MAWVGRRILENILKQNWVNLPQTVFKNSLWVRNGSVRLKFLPFSLWNVKRLKKANRVLWWSLLNAGLSIGQLVCYCPRHVNWCSVCKDVRFEVLRFFSTSHFGQQVLIGSITLTPRGHSASLFMGSNPLILTDILGAYVLLQSPSLTADPTVFSYLLVTKPRRQRPQPWQR